MLALQSLASTLSLAIAIAVAPSLIGCATGRAAQDPQTALRRYAQSVREGDARAAYEWLSDDAKKRMPFNVFERTLKDRPEDLIGMAGALDRPSETREIRATVTTAEGDELGLVYEDGAWHADLSAIDLYSQADPVTSLKSFVRAFDAKRYDVLVRFAPLNHREGLSPEILKAAWEGEQRPEMLELVQALHAQLPTAQAEIVGDRATVAYGQSSAVMLLLEDGAWKIEEF